MSNGKEQENIECSSDDEGPMGLLQCGKCGCPVGLIKIFGDDLYERLTQDEDMVEESSEEQAGMLLEEDGEKKINRLTRSTAWAGGVLEGMAESPQE